MVLLVLIPTEGFQSSVGRRPCFRENNVVQRKASVVSGPPIETKPDYENIHGPLGKGIDNVFMKMFRSRLADQVGIDSELPQVRRYARWKHTSQPNSLKQTVLSLLG